MKKKIVLFGVFVATMSALAASSGESKKIKKMEKGERISDFMNYAAHKLRTEKSVIIQMN